MRLQFLRANVHVCRAQSAQSCGGLISFRRSLSLCPAVPGRLSRQLVSRPAPRSSYSMVVSAVAPATAVAEQAPSGKQISHKVELLRQEMARADHGKGVQAYIIPTEDPHMSEYAPSSDERRHFISDFTGSAGTAVVTNDAAALWTDGRYFLQAEQQLGPGWKLMKGGTPGCPEIPEWLATTLPEGSRIGIDPFLHTVDSAKQLTSKLQEAGKQLVPVMEGNLVDKVWGDARPAAPSGHVRIHKLEHAGRTVQDKLTDMRKAMKEAGANALLVTAVDEVAWLLNLRGGDVSHNPVFTSYVLLEASEATLYVDQKKVTQEVSAHLKEAGVGVKPYEQLVEDVQKVAQSHVKIWADPSKVSFAITTAAKSVSSEGSQRKRPRTDNGGDAEAQSQQASKLFVEKPSPVALAKAIKNKAELEGMKEAHLRDAVALCGLLAFLQTEIGSGRVMTEVEVDDELQARRKAQPGYIEASFPTIAGAGPNGAIIHYRAQPDTCNKVDGDTLLLLDSGGQFDCGTTDVTRTMHFGTPSEHQKTCFTRVLQGHIALDQAVFPEGTPGLALDTLARAPLWRLGLNYRHGTGHGVGAALNVHEGPHSISTRLWVTQPLMAGMIVSNEPGYYEDNAFGIRIENLLHIKEAETPFKFGGQKYFDFERLTLIPLQRKMILKEALSQTEVKWVDAYHQEVWQKVSPRVQDEKLLEWIRKHTQPL